MSRSEVTWNFEGGDLQDNIYLSCDENDISIHILTIFPVKESNIGTYTCQGQDTVQSKYVYFISKAVVKKSGNISYIDQTVFK